MMTMEGRLKKNLKTALQNQSSFTLLNHGGQDVVVNKIPNFLGDDALISFSQSCKFLFFSLQPQSSQALDRYKNLCDYIHNRDHEKVGHILMQHPSLLMRKGELTDGFLDENNNKRKFKEISPLQYAFWAWDAPMLYWMLLYYSISFVNDNNKDKVETLAWIRLIHTLSQEDRDFNYKLNYLKSRLDILMLHLPEERKKAIGDHLKEIEELGTEYGAHYDFLNIITPLQIYVDNAQNSTRDECDWYWSLVKKGQSQTIQQVVHEYCRGRTFYPLPTFTDDHLTLRNDIYLNTRSWQELVYFEGGLRYGIVRSHYAKAWCVTHPYLEYNHIENDLNAVRQLSEVRIAQVNELVAQLNLTKELETKCGM
jgi:hypothetical protein